MSPIFLEYYIKENLWVLAFSRHQTQRIQQQLQGFVIKKDRTAITRTNYKKAIPQNSAEWPLFITINQ
jgi:hypothetical protein